VVEVGAGTEDWVVDVEGRPARRCFAAALRPERVGLLLFGSLWWAVVLVDDAVVVVAFTFGADDGVVGGGGGAGTVVPREAASATNELLRWSVVSPALTCREAMTWK
jgi:hypothetical protein